VTNIFKIMAAGEADSTCLDTTQAASVGGRQSGEACGAAQRIHSRQPHLAWLRRIAVAAQHPEKLLQRLRQASQ
jgi:hypothetical protein